MIDLSCHREKWGLIWVCCESINRKGQGWVPSKNSSRPFATIIFESWFFQTRWLSLSSLMVKGWFRDGSMVWRNGDVGARTNWFTWVWVGGLKLVCD